MERLFDRERIGDNLRVLSWIMVFFNVLIGIFSFSGIANFLSKTLDWDTWKKWSFLIKIILALALVFRTCLIKMLLDGFASLVDSGLELQNTTFQAKTVSHQEETVSRSAPLAEEAKGQPAPLPSDGWVCKSCGSTNSKFDLICKKCGEYR